MPEFVAVLAVGLMAIGWWDSRRFWRGIAEVHRENARRWEERYYEANRDFRALVEKCGGR